MINFLHTYNPEPILISLGPIHIYWYGLFIILGLLAGIFVVLKLANFYNVSKNKLLDLIFWLILGGLLGARLYHIFLELPYYLNNPLDIFKLWQGGLAIHGGIIAGLIIVWQFAKKQNLSFWLLSGIIAPGLALAQAIGRWGNYFNQELFGKPTDLPWGIPINIMNRPLEYISSEFFQPVFLYESLGNFLIFLILITLHVWIIKKGVMGYGLWVMGYLILYSLLRFFLEFIRIDSTPIILNMRFPQIISLLIIGISILIILLPKFKKPANIN